MLRFVLAAAGVDVHKLDADWDWIGRFAAPPNCGGTLICTCGADAGVAVGGFATEIMLA